MSFTPCAKFLGGLGRVTTNQLAQNGCREREGYQVPPTRTAGVVETSIIAIPM